MTAPVLNVNLRPVLPSILENATNPAGTSVATMLVDGSITDADGPAVEAIIVQDISSWGGTWQYSLNSGSNWLNFNVAALNWTINRPSLPLPPTALLRYIPFGEASGLGYLFLKAWDMSDSLVSGTYALASFSPGVSSSNVSALVTVTAVNDAPSFVPPNGSGQAPVQFGNIYDFATSVLVQPDGKIVTAGYADYSFGGNHKFAVSRQNADGSLDTSFGGTGKVTVQMGSVSSGAEAIVMQPDGKFVLVGSAYNGVRSQATILRLNSNGSLDTSFDADGKLVLSLGSFNDDALAVTVQTDNKIVVAGYTHNGVNNDFAVLRLNANGSVDASFGVAGKAVIPIGTAEDYAYSVVAVHSQKTLVAGYARNGGNADFALIQLNANGSLDTNFGTNGKVVVPIGAGDDIASQVIINSSGNIFVVGSAAGATGNDFAIAKFENGGDPYPGFGTNGKVIVSFGSGNDVAKSVSVDASGRVVVAGYSVQGGFEQTAFLRLNDNGTLDTSFGVGGKLLLPIGTDNSNVEKVITQPDGKLVAVGSASFGALEPFLVFRLNPDGSYDKTFGGNSPVNTLGATLAYTENGAAMVMDSDVGVYDIELASGANFAGDYNGATLALARNGGANAQDIFSAKSGGTLAALTHGGALVVGGITVGSVTANNAGTLVLTFNSSGTSARVNSVLQQIAYSNASDAPSASAQINWTFSDGNVTGQGTGGALTATGSVTFNITAVNDAPVATAVVLAATPRNTVKAISAATLLASVIDVDSLNLSITALSIASGGGTLTGSAVSGWNYTPALNFSGNVSFNYTASDGFLSSSSTASLVVTAVNVAPVATPVVLTASPEDTAKAITAAQLLLGVSDVDTPALGLSITALSIASGGGTLIGNAASGWSYTPLANFNGAVTFNYTASDGLLASSSTASLSITAVNDAPVATVVVLAASPKNAVKAITAATLLAAVSDVDSAAASLSITALSIASGGGTLAGNAISGWSYTPAANFSGNVSFNYTASDGFLSSSSTASLVVTNVNVAPVATPVALTASPEDTAKAITAAQLLVGVSDVDTLPAGLSITALSVASGGGTLTGNAVSGWSYAPLANFNGVVTFNYTASDGALTSSSTASLTVTPVNDLATGTVTLSGTARQGQPMTASNTLADVDGLGPLAYQWLRAGVAISGANAASYVPVAADVGSTLSVRVSYADGGGTLESVLSSPSAVVAVTSGPPVLNASASPAFPSIAANAANPAGISVAGLVVDGSITDPDGVVVEAIAITAVDTRMGTVQFSLDGGSRWLDVRSELLNSSTNQLGLALGPTALLRVLPFGEQSLERYGNFADRTIAVGNAITFVAWDQSDGRASGSYLTVTPGVGAFSLASDTVSQTLLRINHAPVFLDFTGFPIAAEGAGQVTTSFGASSHAAAVAVQADGKMLVAGSVGTATDQDFALVRYNANGHLDTSFSGDGKERTSFGPGLDQARAMVVQSDGKIIVVGTAHNGSNLDFAVARYNTDGSLDASFDGDGKLSIALGARNDTPKSVALQADGKIVVVGDTQVLNPADQLYGTAMAAVRLNVDGSLDTSFRGTGKYVYPRTMDSHAEDVAIQADGKIVIVGYSGRLQILWVQWDVEVLRLTESGDPDPDFGNDGPGTTSIQIGSYGGTATAVALQSDGTILVAGAAFDAEDFAFFGIPPGKDMMVTRLTADGRSFDASFGRPDYVWTAPGFGEARDLVVQADSKIVVIGDGNEVARLNSDGSLDGNFGIPRLSLGADGFFPYFE